MFRMLILDVNISLFWFIWFDLDFDCKFSMKLETYFCVSNFIIEWTDADRSNSAFEGDCLFPWKSNKRSF